MKKENDLKIVNGLSKDEWLDTLRGLKEQLASVKMQGVVLYASIQRVEEELTRYD